MGRTVRPDDVGKTLTVRCLCGCDNPPDTGVVTGYIRNTKSNHPNPVYIDHDRFVFNMPAVGMVWSVDMREVVEDGPDSDP